MIQINIHEAKTHLSKYLAQVELGETIILCKHNRPIAEIRSLNPKPVKPRETGWAKGQFTLPPAFFDPLPADIQKAFDGESA